MQPVSKAGSFHWGWIKALGVFREEKTSWMYPNIYPKYIPPHLTNREGFLLLHTVAPFLQIYHWGCFQGAASRPWRGQTHLQWCLLQRITMTELIKDLCALLVLSRSSPSCRNEAGEAGREIWTRDGGKGAAGWRGVDWVYPSILQKSQGIWGFKKINTPVLDVMRSQGD